MNNTALAGIIVGAVALAGAGAILANSGYNPLQQYAKVVSVEPAFDVTRTPRQVCGDEATLAQEAGLSTETNAAAPATPAAASTAETNEAAAPTDGKKEAGAVAETDCLVVYDTRSVQHDDEVGHADGREPMGHEDRDAAIPRRIS